MFSSNELTTVNFKKIFVQVKLFQFSLFYVFSDDKCLYWCGHWNVFFIYLYNGQFGLDLTIRLMIDGRNISVGCRADNSGAAISSNGKIIQCNPTQLLPANTTGTHIAVAQLHIYSLPSSKYDYCTLTGKTWFENSV